MAEKAMRSTAAGEAANSCQLTADSFRNLTTSAFQLLAVCCQLSLPHFAKQFAAYAFAACLAAGHYALGRGHDGDAKAALDALDLVAANVDTAAGARNAGQVADGCVGAAVLQVHAQYQLAFFFLRLVVRDIALFL